MFSKSTTAKKEKTVGLNWASVGNKKVFNLYKGEFHHLGYKFDRKERFVNTVIAKDFDAAVEKAYGPDFGRLKKTAEGRYIDIDGKTVYHVAVKRMGK